MIYRYELAVDGEYQGVGIFHGLTEIFDEEMIKSLTRIFNDELEIPLDLWKVNEVTCAFFTESGNEKFKVHIQNIINSYADNGLFDVMCIKLDETVLNEDDIFYQDEYQIVVADCVVNHNYGNIEPNVA